MSRKFNDAEKIVREELKKLGPFTAMKVNRLADLMYQLHGYTSQPDLDYLQSKHPQEQLIFQFALLANWFFEDRDDSEGKDDDADSKIKI
jgi:hypothetical protein